MWLLVIGIFVVCIGCALVVGYDPAAKKQRTRHGDGLPRDSSGRIYWGVPPSSMLPPHHAGYSPPAGAASTPANPYVPFLKDLEKK